VTETEGCLYGHQQKGQEEGMMPYCSNCGTELSEEELIRKTCFFCGLRLLKEQSIAEAKPPEKNDHEKELKETAKQ
jgi:predicted nucleic acid binding AN1-type Zn finger protein